ncbi:MAG: AMP-binding protein [Acidimicrobiia bacterium]
MGPRDALTSLQVLARAGLLRPLAPRRLVAAGLATRHFGVNYAGGFAAAAARRPDRLCIVDDRGTLTWSEVDRRSNALARALADRGVEEGDVVAMLCRNHRGFVEATAACSKLGATILYLNTGFAGPQLREVIGRDRAVALLYDEEFSGVVADGADVPVKLVAWPEGAGHRGAGHDGDPAVETFDDVIAGTDSSRPAAPSRPGRSIILTSGTTGTPKGAPRDQTSPIGPVIAMLDRIPYREGETFVVPAPLFHSWGFGNMSLAILLTSTLVLRRHFDPEQTLADVARHRAGALIAVPVMLQRILGLPAPVRRRYDTSSLRIVALSGSAIPTGLATRWMDEFGDNLYNLYGSTEVGWGGIATPADLRADPTTAGRPPRDTIVKLLDRDGHEVPTGGVGRIFVHSTLLFDGYTGGGGKEMVDGLMSTGDVGRFDAAGRLYVDGRDDEMIVSGGENVFPLEVEHLLSSHPDVVEAAVVGVDDEEFGQRLKAFVVVRGGASLTTEAVQEFVRTNLARFKVPREVVFLEQLPRNPAGKVLKREL